MESIILRALVVYILVFIILRMAGKRTLGEMTAFDLVLLLIISEAVQNALVDDDKSITGSFLVVLTLVFADVMVSLATNKFRFLDSVVNGIPLIILENGKPLQDRMDKARLQEDDILEAARKTQGLENMDQIKYAVLEKDGSISIIPFHLNENGIKPDIIKEP
ncbi:DUF421 domain-containing protein [Rufibacter sp. XAAS-G3-1]|uniref:DUF421 domain-containing protein n=1 Tax=Rufibacter sp. XAAS-G3-1 TaxID=2729134 RepID=UPI0015E6C6EA|nr:YetF domain-containing protein [Rufibacter sp. XAAS-G3-1]